MFSENSIEPFLNKCSYYEAFDVEYLIDHSKYLIQVSKKVRFLFEMSLYLYLGMKSSNFFIHILNVQRKYTRSTLNVLCKISFF